MKDYSILLLSLLFILYSCQEKTKQTETIQTGKNDSLKQNKTTLATYVLFVNIKDKNLDRTAFAKALAYSIDRDKIFENLYHSEFDSISGGPGIHGIIPPNLIREYTAANIKGYNLDLDSAKFYLKKSGFISEKNKITIKVFSWGAKSYSPTEHMRMNWYNMGIQAVDLYNVRYTDLLKNAISGTEGIYFFYIPIPSNKRPETYLGNFYSKKNMDSINANILKKGIYMNLEFDKYYEAAIQSKDRKEAIKNFELAEQILINDAIIIPLWYGAMPE